MRKIFFLGLTALAFNFVTNKNLPAVPAQKSAAKIISIANGGDTKAKKSLLTRVNFEDSLKNLYNRIGLSSYDLDYNVFRMGMVGYYSLKTEGALNEKDLLTIINFSRPSTEKRFYTIDLKNKKVLYHTYVAHGRNTGENMATEFSNVPDSNQSSLGFYVTGETYVGSKGYSLRLDGKEKSFNDRIRSRAVVVHAADYAAENWIKRYGRLGRSQGCPALPPDLSKEVINTIKDKTAIFTYFPDEEYLNTSQYLKVEELFEKFEAESELATTSVEGRS